MSWPLAQATPSDLDLGELDPTSVNAEPPSAYRCFHPVAITLSSLSYMTNTAKNLNTIILALYHKIYAWSMWPIPRPQGAGEYIALSYVWGDAHELRTIQVDGRLRNITANLEAALRGIRDTERVLDVWADALCINQDDVSEKTSQVRRMGAVYAYAGHTIIYLDESSRELDAVLEEIKSASKPRSMLKVDERLVEILGISEAARQALNRIISRPWFKRVWTLQEVVLSKDPWVQCGSRRLRWTTLVDFVRVAFKNAPHNHSAPEEDKEISEGSMDDDLSVLLSMDQARNEYHFSMGEGGTLLDVVSARRGLGASDPRDIIFAQMDLARDKFQATAILKVDYSRSVVDIFTTVAEYALQQGKDIFQMMDFEDRAHRYPGLPSWVPDWTQSISDLAPDFQGLKIKIDSTTYYHLRGNSKLLAIPGMYLGSISKVGRHVTLGGPVNTPESLGLTQLSWEEHWGPRYKAFLSAAYQFFKAETPDTEEAKLALEEESCALLSAWLKRIGLGGCSLPSFERYWSPLAWPRLKTTNYAFIYEGLFGSNAVESRFFQEPVLAQTLIHLLLGPRIPPSYREDSYETSFYHKASTFTTYQKDFVRLKRQRFCIISGESKGFLDTQVDGATEITHIPENARVGDKVFVVALNRTLHAFVLRLAMDNSSASRGSSDSYSVVGPCDMRSLSDIGSIQQLSEYEEILLC
ncbi:hypothetical protein BP6252_06304 [Coleophoma cylindrospora]|uniref:Heterokaryon incompatibility domain-containing protein n=1 Tax=Coleophoma cylindrospora TaxID=1849047 RepID=A0A3D8RM48_9HELO|nr:hypothetical protein BP6252_06304 [Coleophoma cylindrospora]